MVSGGDSSARALGATDGPVLVEGSSSRDGRLVHLLVSVDIVDGSIASHGSLEGHAAAGVVFAIAFHDVVFDEGASGPAVDSEVGISGGAERPGEVDVSNTVCL